MFEHLYRGSPPLLFALLTLGGVAHIASGGVAIISGAGALVVRKGGRWHRRFGTAFVAAMLSMSTAAALLAMVAVERGHADQAGNVFGGVFAFYLVTTGWLTVRSAGGVVGKVEIGGGVAAIAIAAVALLWFLPMALGAEGRRAGVPIGAPFTLAGIAVLLAILDFKVIRQGGITGVSRTLRHLWRMCSGLFIATGSFFIGQQRDMPMFMQGSPVLLLLGFAPLVAMAYWLFDARRHPTKKSQPALALEPSLEYPPSPGRANGPSPRTTSGLFR